MSRIGIKKRRRAKMKRWMRGFPLSRPAVVFEGVRLRIEPKVRIIGVDLAYTESVSAAFYYDEGNLVFVD